MNTTLGVVVTADEVCQQVQAALETYLPDVFGSITDERTIDVPQTYEQVPTRDAVIAANLPAVGIWSAGTTTAPERDEDGYYAKTWRITVGYYARSDTYTNTQWTVRTAAALIQALLCQVGVADGVSPASETFDLVEASASRTLAGAAVDIDVMVQQAFTDQTAPPYGPDYTAETVGTDVEVIHPALA